MATDIEIAKYYGTGKTYYVEETEMLEPIVSEDALSRFLTILHNSDGESSLLADDKSGSIAQYATVLNRLRSEAKSDNTLIVSSGDNFLAGIQYEVSKGKYDAQALSMMNYDVAAIGNHEFDFGNEGFLNFIKEADFPFVSSNLIIDRYSELYPYTQNKIFRAYVIQKAGRNIGIVGATTDYLKYISSPGKGVTAADVEEHLQAAVTSLTNRGLNVIIALTHLQNVEEEKKLAENIAGVDVFVAGGGDNLLGNENNEYLEGDQPEGAYPYETTSATGEPTYVIATDGGYNYVGRLTILFDENGLADRIDLRSSGPVPVTKDVEPNQAIQSQIVDVVEKEVNGLKEKVVGKTNTKLDGTREYVRTRETTMGNAICDSYVYVAKKVEDIPAVDFAFTNGGGIRKSVVIEGGNNVTVYDTLTILPFSNYLTLVTELTPQNIKAMFEHSLASLPEADGRFLQVSKDIMVTFDSSKPAGERVQSITIVNYRGEDDITIYSNGKFITQELTFNAVTNSFTAAGGDGYSTLADISMERKINLPYSYQEGFKVYIQEKTPIAPKVEGRLKDVTESRD